MKKNRMMRAASALLVAVLMTTCTISGTFAKYVTEATGTDSARVARWGFDSTTTTASMNISSLFENVYGETVEGKDGAKVIAPGTWGSDDFGFKFVGAQGAPEVDYTFVVSTDGSDAAGIDANANIQWALDGTPNAETDLADSANWMTWTELLAAIEALDGDVAKVDANNLPTNFAADAMHTVYWRWIFETDATANGKDTTMGNLATLDDVTLKITITATQID